jgi:hypothetical protein
MLAMTATVLSAGMKVMLVEARTAGVYLKNGVRKAAGRSDISENGPR